MIKNKWFSDTELGELKRMSKGYNSESQNTTESEMKLSWKHNKIKKP